MKITEFKKIGKTNRFKLYVDGDFFGIIMDETIIKNSLNTHDDYTESYLQEILAKNQDKVCFDTALTYVSKFTKPEKELRKHLITKGFLDCDIDFAIEKLKSYNYLNDENYAKMYIQNRHDSKGKKAIFYELKNKGIDQEIIQQNLQCITSQEDVIEKLASKFLKNKKDDPKVKEKLFRHLASKGFEFEEINSVVRRILK